MLLPLLVPKLCKKQSQTSSYMIESGTLPSFLVNSDKSHQLVLVKFGKHFGFCLYSRKIISFI